MIDDLGAHAFATTDADRHQLPGIGLVEAGARRADGRPPVLAGHGVNADRNGERAPVEKGSTSVRSYLAA
jgi:hypothetical protein